MSAGNGRIEVGDLVRVVQSCCDQYVGRYYTVTRIEKGWSYCPHCKYHGPHADHAMFGEYKNDVGMPLRWLRRVPPLGELERQRQEDREPERLEV